ncbi:hypothetical protein [Oceaniradius stylonematis]|uniref:hypothetical protein n=1 Tax=Oceaniradius stylonematis TaxID=2184161 RepID=UPI00273F56DF|nr:hypothetical protein [Oceaniradius stylonematis]
MGITINTLGALYDTKERLFGCCRDPSCYHSAQIDLEPLIARYGRGHGCMHRHLAHKLRCTACGGTNCGIQLLPARTPRM